MKTHIAYTKREKTRVKAVVLYMLHLILCTPYNKDIK